MKHQLERRLGKRGQWVLAPVLLLITVWVVFSVFDNPLAQIVSKIGAGLVSLICVLILLDARRKLWTLTSLLRDLSKRVSDLNNQNQSPANTPFDTERLISTLNGDANKAGLDAVAARLENEIRSGFRSLSHNKPTDEAVLRLEAYARHVIAVTSVASSEQSSEIQVNGSEPTEEEI